MPSKLYLSLGSNMGDRRQMLRRALEAIGQRIGKVVSVSSFVETEPWGFQSPHRFLNAACCVETTLSPMRCLRITQQIERELGRTAKTQDGLYHDRPIDIDLLLYDHFRMQSPSLTLPHPRMWERQFVMEPLQQILPSVRPADWGK